MLNIKCTLMFNLGEKYSRNQWITQAYNNVLGTSILQFVK